MQLYCVVDRFGDPCAAPFVRRDLAENVLKIVKRADDEEAEIQVLDSDPWAAQLSAGLLPFKIGVELFPATRKVRETKVELVWPPAETEGLVSEMECYLEYQVWARNRGEAITKLARFATLKRPEEEVSKRVEHGRTLAAGAW